MIIRSVNTTNRDNACPVKKNKKQKKKNRTTPEKYLSEKYLSEKIQTTDH